MDTLTWDNFVIGNRGVLQVLTQDDIHWLLPAAYADAAEHPEFYQFAPPESAT